MIYDAVQMSQQLADGRNIQARNDVYEHTFLEIEGRLNNIEADRHQEKQESNARLANIESNICDLQNSVYYSDYVRRLFPHILPYPFKIDEIPALSHFTMIVHDATGEDFCASKFDSVPYTEYDGSDIYSHITVDFTESEYLRFMHFIADPDIASTFPSWHFYTFRREVDARLDGKRNGKRNECYIVQDSLESITDLYRFKPMDGIPYNDNMSDSVIGAWEQVNDKRKHYPKIYMPEELATMTYHELDRVLRNNIKAFTEVNGPRSVWHKTYYPVDFVPYPYNEKNLYRRSCAKYTEMDHCNIYE